MHNFVWNFINLFFLFYANFQFKYFLCVGGWVVGGLFHSSIHGMRIYENKEKEKEKKQKAWELWNFVLSQSSKKNVCLEAY